MNSKGLSGGIYKPLSPEGIETIHDASLTILEKTGIAYETGLDETVDMLADAGATVDREMKRIRFPRELILEQIAKAPSRVILHARDGKNDLDLTEDKVHLGTGGAAVKILDLETGSRGRQPSRTCTTSADWWTGWITFTFFLRPCIPTDIPESRLRREHVLRLSQGHRQACHERCQRRGGTASHHRHGRHAGRREEATCRPNRLFR
jgi:trimethylamine--corrinoid protein Co-methyltransferase